MTCHRCKAEVFKFGFQNGFQRYRCRTCRKTFSDIQRPLDSLRIEPEKAYQVIRMLCEGVGVRACERLSGLNRRTVLGILETAAAKCVKLMDAKLHNLKVQQVQVDELYAFVNCLQQHTIQGADHERGDQYTFLAIERTSKLILHSLVGKRDKGNVNVFLHGLKARLNGERFQLTTDGFAPYSSHLGSVFKVFRESIDYGTEIKHFATDHMVSTGSKGNRRNNPIVCQWVKREPCIGNPKKKWMTTNHAERTNLSIRLFNRRFTRKTMGFSKTLENHKHSVALMVAHFNFVRVHGAHGKTPAQAHGITDHAWTIEELLSA